MRPAANALGVDVLAVTGVPGGGDQPPRVVAARQLVQLAAVLDRWRTPPATFNTVNQWASRHQRHAAPRPAQRAAGPGGPDRRRDVLQGCAHRTPGVSPEHQAAQAAGATILEGEHSITVSHHGFSWTAIRDALRALPRQRPDRHRTVPG